MKRQQIASLYIDKIKNPYIILPENDKISNEHVWHLFVVRCGNRDELHNYLLENEIQTIIHYPIPPHKQKSVLRVE